MGGALRRSDAGQRWSAFVLRQTRRSSLLPDALQPLRTVRFQTLWWQTAPDESFMIRSTRRPPRSTGQMVVLRHDRQRGSLDLRNTSLKDCLSADLQGFAVAFRFHPFEQELHAFNLSGDDT